MKSRADLDAELFQLRAALPLWRRALGSEEEFRMHCASLAASILDSTEPDDRDYAAAHLRSAFQQHPRIAQAVE
jgi:hypothetical protein